MRGINKARWVPSVPTTGELTAKPGVATRKVCDFSHTQEGVILYEYFVFIWNDELCGI